MECEVQNSPGRPETYFPLQPPCPGSCGAATEGYLEMGGGEGSTQGTGLGPPWVEKQARRTWLSHCGPLAGCSSD